MSSTIWLWPHLLRLHLLLLPIPSWLSISTPILMNYPHMLGLQFLFFAQGDTPPAWCACSVHHLLSLPSTLPLKWHRFETFPDYCKPLVIAFSVLPQHSVPICILARSILHCEVVSIFAIFETLKNKDCCILFSYYFLILSTSFNTWHINQYWMNCYN